MTTDNVSNDHVTPDNNIAKLIKSALICLVLILLIALSGCIGSRVHTDLDHEANLNNYNTFKFTDTDDQAGPNPVYHSSLLERGIHAQIATELEKRGIEETVKHPDLLIAYHTYTEKKQNSINNYYPMMYGGWGWRYYPWSFNPYPYGYWNGYSGNYVYTEGTLIIDAINPNTDRLIWRGSISDAIDPTDLHKKAIQAVHLIFTKFPIKPGHVIQPPKSPVAHKTK